MKGNGGRQSWWMKTVTIFLLGLLNRYKNINICFYYPSLRFILHDLTVERTQVSKCFTGNYRQGISNLIFSLRPSGLVLTFLTSSRWNSVCWARSSSQGGDKVRWLSGSLGGPETVLRVVISSPRKRMKRLRKQDLALSSRCESYGPWAGHLRSLLGRCWP